VKGTLTAIGTPEDPIIFTSNSKSPTPGIWDKISFKSQASGKSTVRYSHIEYSEQGIQIAASRIRIENNILENISKYGIKIIDGSSPIISNNTIRTHNIAIRISGWAKPQVINNNLDENGFYGVYVDDNSKPIIEGNHISKTEWGIYSHLAEPVVKDNKITDCTTGILYYLSHGDIEGNVILDSEVNGIKCKYASPNILNNKIEGSGNDGIFAFYSSPEISGNKIFNNSQWGISSLGEDLTEGLNDFQDNLQNGNGKVRQGWYLEIVPKDDRDNILHNVNIEIRDAQGILVFSGNTENEGSMILNLDEHLLRNDGTLVFNSKYYIVMTSIGYKDNETTVKMTENKDIEIILDKEKATNEAISGFEVEVLIFSLLIVIFVSRKRGSDLN
jgi:parallel beta-helix repeat protein